MNKPPVVNFNNGICAESVRGKSNPNSQVYPDGGPQRSVRIHYIMGLGYIYFHLLRIFTFTKPSATRSSEAGPRPGGPM